MIEDSFEFGGDRHEVSHQSRLPGVECLDVGDVAIDLENEIIADQLHPAVDNDFAAVLADVAQLSGPVSIGDELRTQRRQIDGEFGLQKRMAEMPECLIPGKPVETFSPGIPEPYRAIEAPRKHGLMAEREQVGKTFLLFESPVRELEFHICALPGGLATVSRRALALLTLNGEREPQSLPAEAVPEADCCTNTYAPAKRKSRISTLLGDRVSQATGGCCHLSTEGAESLGHGVTWARSHWATQLPGHALLGTRLLGNAITWE